MKEIMVSIVCITYNHEAYIRDAIESFLAQQVNFNYEIIIHDDVSTDGTVEIEKEYEQHYPDMIHGIYQNENQYSKGVCILSYILREFVRGKYIAICEGDDYWTDSFKLQKQVDFLEKYPEYIGTSHNVRCVDGDGNLLHRDFGLYPVCETHIYGMEHALKFDLVAQTASLLFRNFYMDWDEEIWKCFEECKCNGDRKLSVLLGILGDIYYFRDIMANHRRVFEGDSWTARVAGKNLLWIEYETRKELKKLIKLLRPDLPEAETDFHDLFKLSFMKVLSDPGIENIKVCLRFMKERAKECWQ